METTKRTIRNPQAFVGKVIDSTKWNVPEGYDKCEMTGKLHPYSALERTFEHHFFDRQFLIDNHIYCEDAAWLSDEGYDLIIAKLDELGVLDAYYEARYHDRDFCRGSARSARAAWCGLGLRLRARATFSTISALRRWKRSCRLTPRTSPTFASGAGIRS